MLRAFLKISGGVVALGWLVLMGSLVGGPAAEVIRKGDFHQDPDGMPGELRWEKEISIGAGRSVHAAVEVTRRGNGILEVANLRDIQVWNEGSEGPFYVGGLLRAEFVDVTGDGYKDLVITGVEVDPGEKGNGPFGFRAIRRVYVFDPGSGAFRLSDSEGPGLELGP